MTGLFRRQPAAAIASALVFLMFAANSPSAGGDQNPPGTAIPRLSAGPHAGFIVGFDHLNARRSKAARRHTRLAREAGMTIGRIQLDWNTLEPSPGQYDLGALEDAFANPLLYGLQLMMTLETLDTGELTMPADLLDSDGVGLRHDLRFDSPEIQQRMAGLLDWLVPELRSRRVWGLSLGNEPSTNFETIERPETTVAAFFREASKHVRTLDRELAVTVTFVTPSDRQTREFIKNTMPYLDFATYNFYCIDGGSFQTNRAAGWREAVAIHQALAQGREVVYQELGCPAGYADPKRRQSEASQYFNATEKTQTAFFEFAMAEIVRNPGIRAAMVFQLYDWSPELTSYFNKTLIDDEPEAELILGILGEWLETSGLCRWSDSECRPAWQVFLNGLREIRAFRTQ